MSWRRKFTLVMIPDANNRILRLRVPRMIMVMIPFILLFIICSIATWLYVTKLYYLHSEQALHEEIMNQEQRFQDNARLKDQTIDALQQEIIDLTEEADSIRIKMDELKTLENEIKKYSKIPTAVENHPPSTPQKIGGEAISLSPANIHEVAAQTKTAFSSLHQDLNVLSARLITVKDILAEKDYLERITPSIWPTRTKQINSGFGYRKDPFTQKPSFHSGLDIEGELNDPVYATAEGTVVKVGWDTLEGNHILIQHAKGIQTHYMHLHQVLVKQGEQVVKNQKIGLIGSTGRSTGTHLHYEVLYNGKPIDPSPFLQKR